MHAILRRSSIFTVSPRLNCISVSSGSRSRVTLTTTCAPLSVCRAPVLLRYIRSLRLPVLNYTSLRIQVEPADMLFPSRHVTAASPYTSAHIVCSAATPSRLSYQLQPLPSIQRSRLLCRTSFNRFFYSLCFKVYITGGVMLPGLLSSVSVRYE